MPSSSPSVFRRRRCGRGFTYLNSRGQTVRDARLRRWFASLVIPGAWTEVEISSDKNADLLVTGRDGAGRKQYIYHPDFRQGQEAHKFERMERFAESLGAMRQLTGRHLRQRKLGREKVLACMVRLLDLAYFRPGSPAYARQNDSYGLTTLRSRHLRIEGDELIFAYRGKAGKPQRRHVRDARLAKVVAELDELPGYEIFKYIDSSGERVQVRSQDLNAYIREVMGEEFSAKDFRTWAGTMVAAVTLDRLGPSEQPKTAEQRVRQAVVKVAERLGNTTAVARSSYINPLVIEHYQRGLTMTGLGAQIANEIPKQPELSQDEVGVLCLLRAPL